MKTKNYFEKTKTRIKLWSLITSFLLMTGFGVRAQVNCVDLACPSNINSNTNAGQCSAIVNYALPAVTNNCCVAPTSVPGYTYLGIFGSHTYFMSTVAMDWPSANAAAIAAGGKLVSINSPAENAFLLSVTAGNYFLIGGFQNHSNPNYSEPSGGWEWVDGSPFTYTNWAGGEPSNSGSGEDYMEFYGADQGLWNDLPIFLEPFAIEFGCDITTTLVSGLPSGSTFPIGSTTVTYQADDDNGHTSSCSFNVVVTDHENPVINCPSNINVNSTAGICGAIVNYNLPSATDNCTGVNVIQTTGLASGSTFPIGTTVNTFVATDASGNTATCSFNVVVNDNFPPVINCPSNISVNPASGQCTAVVNYSLPSVIDNCCIAQTSVAGYNYLGSFGGHTYFMSTVAMDWPSANAAAIAAGGKLVSINSPAENAFLLSVTAGNYFLIGGFQNHSNPNYSEPSGGWEWVDGSPFTYTNWAGGEPSNSGSGEDYMEFYGANQGLWNDLPIYLEPFSVEFGCPVITPTLLSGLPSGSVFPSGTTVVTYQASDANGNMATCSFNVTVNDNQAPVPNLEALPDIIAQCSASATTIPTANDNCAGTITGTTSDPITYNAEGNYTIHWTYNDGHGNSSTQNQTVIVHDVTAPVPNVASLPNLIAQCSASVITIPTANDNCAGTVTGTTSDPLMYNAEGTYIIHWSYSDGHGNSSSQNQTVIVHDVTAPVPNFASLPNVTGQCSATVASAPVANDNCAGVITGTTSDPLTYSAEGTYTIHWTYNDGHGNSSSQNQTVIVHDVTSPVPNVASLPNVTGQCSAAVTTAPKATDNCAGQITGTTSDPLTYGAEGTYIIHWSYNDGHGNIANQNQTVIVHDATAPVISGCPGNINSCVNVVSWTPPTASDNCSLQSFTHNHNPGETFPNGTTVVTYTANDGHGNISTCSFNVVVSTSSSFTLTIAASATTVCQGSPVTLTASGANTYSWNNGVINGTAFIPPAGATTYTVVGTTAGGCTKSASITITANAPPAVPGGYDDYKCGTGTIKLYTTVGTGETADWYSAATGGTLLASGTLSYTTPSISTTTTYYVQARKTATGCVSLTRKSITAFVSQGAPANPGTISGPTYGLCNVTGINYSIAPVAGVLYYYWFVPNGATITAGQGTTQITVNFSSPSSCSDDIYVFAVNACGISYSQLDISGQTAAPAAISGPEYGVCSMNGVNYSFAPVFGAASYTWTVPYGATIVGANSTTLTTTSTSINVNYGNNFSGSGNICVKTNNACGSSSTSCKQVNAKPDMPSSITGASSVCAHATVVYQVSPLVSGATSYNWTVPNGASVTAGQGTSQATVHFGTSSGNVSVKAVNGCGYSNYKSKAISISCREAENITTISSFTAYPNPAHNLLTVNFDSKLKGECQLKLNDITGRLVISETFSIEEGGNNLSIDLSKLPSAVYLLEVKSETESWKTRVIKE